MWCAADAMHRFVGGDHISPGLADEITTALSRFRWMFVMASGSLTRFARDNRDENAIRQAFGIDFLLDGTIQRNRSRLRITLRLLDLRAGQSGRMGAALRATGQRPAVGAG